MVKKGQNTMHKTKDCATRIPLKRKWNQVLRKGKLHLWIHTMIDY